MWDSGLRKLFRGLLAAVQKSYPIWSPGYGLPAAPWYTAGFPVWWPRLSPVFSRLEVP